MAGGGTCDYPDEIDVVAGVQYDFGNLTGTFECPTPPTPVPPSSTSSPFAAIAYAIRQRLALMLSLNEAYIIPVANDRYSVTINEPFFLYLRFYGIAQPRDPGLDYTNAGAGRLFTPVARRMRVYVYTRTAGDLYGQDPLALFGYDPAQTIDTPPTFPGQFIAEEIVYNALTNWTPLDGAGAAMTITPLHPLDASEEPERAPEADKGLIRSCVDFEVVFGLAIDPTEPIG